MFRYFQRVIVRGFKDAASSAMNLVLTSWLLLSMGGLIFNMVRNESGHTVTTADQIVFWISIIGAGIAAVSSLSLAGYRIHAEDEKKHEENAEKLTRTIQDLKDSAVHEEVAGLKKQLANRDDEKRLEHERKLTGDWKDLEQRFKALPMGIGAHWHGRSLKGAPEEDIQHDWTLYNDPNHSARRLCEHAGRLFQKTFNLPERNAFYEWMFQLRRHGELKNDHPAISETEIFYSGHIPDVGASSARVSFIYLTNLPPLDAAPSQAEPA